jgi:ZIP family zinc transporter
VLTWGNVGLTLIPVGAAGVAGVSATLRPPGERITSGLQHFAAGGVFAAAAIELLPQVLAHNPPVAIVGFAVGLAVMFAMRAYTDRLEAREQEAGGSAFPAGLIGATAVDFLVDGLVLGAGFAAGGHTGLLLVLAVTVEYLFVGLSLSASLGSSAGPSRTVAVPIALSLLTLVGAGVGMLALGNASTTVLAGVLAFGAVAFMYLVTEELLVKAHERGETALGSATYFIGFLIYLIIHETLR